MSIWQVALAEWDLEPSVLLGCAALAGAYVWALKGKVDRHAVLFMSGVLVLLLSLVSPIDVLGDHYLFSMHMVQHLLMILLVPPLLLAGIPEDLASKALAWKPLGRAERVLSVPLLAWLIGEGTTWIWHAPPLYEAALESDAVHVFQHFTFLVASTIFWWPILAPLKDHRIPALAGVVYLVAAALSSSLLGILLTFAPAGIYPTYLHPKDDYGLLSTIRRQWGLTPEVDQRAGGMIMWVPGGLAYLIGMMATLARWYSEPEADEEEEAPGDVAVAATTNGSNIKAITNSIPTEGV